MAKAFIVYGTRLGATASTSEEIAKILREEGLEVKVVDAKKERVKDIAEYDLFVVGSGIAMGRWTSKPEDFLKRFRGELTGKNVALFVCCGNAAPSPTAMPEEVVKARKTYLDDKVTHYGLNPVALGFFGGVYDYNNMPW
jgi:menaquinone-dependent protoporphyrinogen oxidase